MKRSFRTDRLLVIWRSLQYKCEKLEEQMETHGYGEDYSTSQTFQPFRKKSPNGPLKSKRFEKWKNTIMNRVKGKATDSRRTKTMDCQWFELEHKAKPVDLLIFSCQEYRPPF